MADIEDSVFSHREKADSLKIRGTKVVREESTRALPVFVPGTQASFIQSRTVLCTQVRSSEYLSGVASSRYDPTVLSMQAIFIKTFGCAHNQV